MRSTFLSRLAVVAAAGATALAVAAPAQAATPSNSSVQIGGKVTGPIGGGTTVSTRGQLVCIGDKCYAPKGSCYRPVKVPGGRQMAPGYREFTKSGRPTGRCVFQ